MATTTTLFEVFANEADADAFMRTTNRTIERANKGKRSSGGLWAVLIEGPADDFVVLDMETAIEMGCLYKWAI